MVSKYINYLGIHVMKDIKNYKTLMREVKNNLNKWSARSHLEIRIINIVRVFILPKLVHRFNANLKPSADFM